MRQYNIKLFTIFGIFFLVLSTILIVFYGIITNNYIKGKAIENLSSYNIGVSTQLEVSLNRTKDTFDDYVDDFIEKDLDVISNLNALNSYDVIAKKTDIGYEINDTIYPYAPAYKQNTYYNRPMSFYPLTLILEGQTDEKIYVSFEHEGYVVLIEAKVFFETILAPYNSIENRFVLFHKDGYVYYDEKEEMSTFQLGSKISQANRTAFFEDLNLNQKEQDVYEMNIFDQNSFFAYNRLKSIDSENVVFFGQAVKTTVLLSTMNYLTNSLLFAFIAIFILFIMALVILYRLLSLKNEDIESARMIHYYIKPVIVKVRPNGKIYYYNKSFKRMFKQFKTFKNLSDFQTRDQLVDIKERITKQEPFVCIFNDPDGDKYIRFIPVRYAFSYALIGDDITKLEETYKYHREIAFYHPITHEPNMNYLKADLKALLGDAKLIRHRNSLVIFTIFKFGDITKVIGETLASEVLEYVAKNTKETFGKLEGKLYQISFDRFAVLFQNLPTYSEIDLWGERLLAKFEKPIDIDKNRFALQFRIGQFNIDQEQYSELNDDKIYDNTILALNRSLGLHSQKPVVYDITFGQSLSRRQVIETDMITAIDRKEFVMFLQPQYSLDEERIVGFEALVRWDNPKYKLDSPAEFIEIAENNNMIIDIGRIVMEETFKMAKILEPYNIKISMNISPVQILQAGFVAEISNAFNRYELKEHSISIEITETFLMTSFDMIIEKLKLLQTKGFDIHLDDFGTGYSSLLYLKELPIDAIKIDKEFTKYSNSDKHSKAIINMIISLSKNLNLSVIAEGVEDDKQFKFLQRSGCNIIQGYYIGKAMKLDDAISIIKAYNIEKSAPLLTKKR
ncbi:MAG: GGDEF domain-containing phosphodiesterase [Acholeplasma sp.]|nr:GGDEF domain-containing phosphodiesterase [Acholeplasma sp.]